ncbi:MAG: hypothetical protein HY826_11165, partial [Actinobacteria bacterium]|nr:hypothetical protein [Actinomycetota bacterium]
MSHSRGFVVGTVAALLVSLAVPVGGFVQAAPPPGDTFHGLVPARLMDTRVGGSTIDGLFAGGGPVGIASVTNVTISNRGGVPASGVGAVALNVTATGPTSDSFVTVWPAGAAQPNASNLNLRANITTPNMVIVALGAGGQISLFNERGNTDLIVDVLGWFPTGV